MEDIFESAFPCPEDWKQESGMSIRDYFAIRTLQALIQCQAWTFDQAEELKDHLPKMAYDFADHLLAERNRG